MLRTLKKNKIINTIVRNVFKLVYQGLNMFENDIMSRWDISGTVTFKLKDKKIALFSNCDDHGVRDLFYGWAWEKNELEVWTILADKANTIFDIGANTGIYSIISSKFNPQAKIYAFEPNPVNSKRLEKNIKLNRCQNVSSTEKALGDKESIIKFTVPTDDSISLVSSIVGPFSRSFFNIKYKEIDVQQTTLDDFVEQEKIPHVDLIKIDVEYYELNVLKGARKTLAETSPVILCEVFMYEVLAGDKPDAPLVNSISNSQAKDIQEFLANLNYYFYAIGSRGILRVDNLLSDSDGGRNYIFSKQLSSNLYIPYKNRSEILALLNH